MAKILIVDDEPNIIKVIKEILQDEDHIVFSAKTGQEAIDFVKKNDIDLTILDVWLPDVDGLEVLKKIKEIQGDSAVIMISGHGSIDIAVKSTKMGAYDFLEKPPSMERIVTVTNNALEVVNLRRENKNLKQEKKTDDELIGSSPSMLDIKATIEKAAATNARVFITGANGTGKELVAKAIYRKSKRLDKPFVKVNCAAIPDELIESELFGHEKGAFTGAVSRRMGKFELANNGTLFLDEICDMSASAQAKVLRVLQENELERVGGNETIKVDVRIIAATNVDVLKAIDRGEFREDLYYRLNVIPIYVPPLSERKDDVKLLVDYYLNVFSNEHGIGHKMITEEGMDFLENHQWPGNVRQLKNILERVCIMVPGDTVDRVDLEKYLGSGESGSPKKNKYTGNSSLKNAKDDFERDFIHEALKRNHGNISATSKEIGVERTNLYRKIRQLNIDSSEYSGDE